MLRKNSHWRVLKQLAVLVGALGLLLAACSPPAALPTASAPAPTAPPTQVEPGPLPTETAGEQIPGTGATETPTAAASVSTEGQIRLVLAADGNEARYLVTEQLANVSLPGDAIGRTDAVTGAIVINPDGTLVSGESKFTVDLTQIQSDQSRRDNFVRDNTLETREFPTAEFVAMQALGLPSPLPTSGDVTFQLVGDMTLHGVTQPATWEVTAQIVDGQELVGTARTSLKFADFEIPVPRVPSVLSVEDNIRLEIDFHLVRES